LLIVEFPYASGERGAPAAVASRIVVGAGTCRIHHLDDDDGRQISIDGVKGVE
jgi:hypothetical protein